MLKSENNFLMNSIKKVFSRKLFATLALGLFFTMSATDVFAGGGFLERWRHRHHHGGHHHGGSHCPAPPSDNTVGAPLDGGILTILLGGAGVAYFARKKKKNQE